MENLVIVGCGSQARYVIDIVTENREYNILGLVDLESGNMVNEIINGVRVVCSLEKIDNYFSSDNSKVIVAHGDFSLKLTAVSFLFGQEYTFASAISPLAFISKYSKVGVGCILNPHVVVMPNAKVGDHVVMAPIAPCGQCSRCLNLEGAYCEREEVRGWGILPDGRTPLKDKEGKGVAIGFNTGFYSDYAVVPSTAVAKIPNDVPFEIASLLGCAVVSGYGAVVNTAKVDVGSSILVVGLGGVATDALYLL